MALEEFNHFFKDNKKYYNEEEIDNGTINFKPVTMLYRKWSTIDEAQYQPISDFWDIVEKYVNFTKLQGFGTDWSDTDFLYGIIFTDGNIPDECLNEVHQMFGDIELDNSFMIPTDYETTYEGNTDNIKALYDEIWSKGPLAYELEEYPYEGAIRVHVIYKQPVVQEGLFNKPKMEIVSSKKDEVVIHTVEEKSGDDVYVTVYYNKDKPTGLVSAKRDMKRKNAQIFINFNPKDVTGFNKKINKIKVTKITFKELGKAIDMLYPEGVELKTKNYSKIPYKKISIMTEQEILQCYDDIFQESKLSSDKRKELKDSDFALVYTDGNGKKIRKYPIHDEAHVKAAAKMFPRGVPLKYKKKVAHKILRKAHEFDIDTSGWNSVNSYQESFMDEQLNDLEWYDESVKEEYQKMTEGKSTLNKILFALPRLLMAIIKNAFNQKFPEPSTFELPKNISTKKKLDISWVIGGAGAATVTVVAASLVTPKGNVKEKMVSLFDIIGNSKEIAYVIKNSKLDKETMKKFDDFVYKTQLPSDITTSIDKSNKICFTHSQGYSYCEFIRDIHAAFNDLIKNISEGYTDILNNLTNKNSNPVKYIKDHASVTVLKNVSQCIDKMTDSCKKLCSVTKNDNGTEYETFESIAKTADEENKKTQNQTKSYLSNIDKAANDVKQKLQKSEKMSIDIQRELSNISSKIKDFSRIFTRTIISIQAGLARVHNTAKDEYEKELDKNINSKNDSEFNEQYINKWLENIETIKNIYNESDMNEHAISNIMKKFKDRLDNIIAKKEYKFEQFKQFRIYFDESISYIYTGLYAKLNGTSDKNKTVGKNIYQLLQEKFGFKKMTDNEIIAAYKNYPNEFGKDISKATTSKSGMHHIIEIYGKPLKKEFEKIPNTSGVKKESIVYLCPVGRCFQSTDKKDYEGDYIIKYPLDKSNK